MAYLHDFFRNLDDDRFISLKLKRQTFFLSSFAQSVGIL